MELFKANDLALGYEGKSVAEHLTFTVSEGDYLCVVGENGSGKSTLIKTLLGLQPPISGELIREKTQIGYLPQQTPVQRDFPATVEEIVHSGFLFRMKLRPFYRKSEKKEAEEKMARLGISELKKRCYRELSGGQQQRVLLARALCATGNLLLLDEPVAGLDPKAASELYSIIHELNTVDGITIIMVSHDIKAVLSYSTHILHVLHKSSYFGTREDYLRSEIGMQFTGGMACLQ